MEQTYSSWLTRRLPRPLAALLLLVALLRPLGASAQYPVSTLAGSGASGFADGTGSTAQFNDPVGVAVDGAGNVYVADTYNHRIRKVSPAGVVTTLAGSTQGFADGAGSAAQFNGPYGVAVDGAGNVYVADYYNSRIRKVTPAGVVTTLAGSSTQGSADGAGSAAQFSGPYGVALDGAGNVYVADLNNQRIRKVTPAGVVTTLAGSTQGFADGAGSAARFNGPTGVALDGAGNVYVADRENQRIRKVSLAAPILTSISPNPAAAGTSVTLTGTDLTGATGVSFNGTAATTFAVVNATTLTATVPTGATTGPVTVTTPGGTSGRVAFTVSTAPTVATAAPSNVGPTDVVLGGNVTATGGDAVTERGVVYSSTNMVPAIGGAGVSKFASGSMGTGSYSVPVGGLLPGTTYYVRAYATNGVGTSYGSALSFTTVAAPTSVVSLNRVSSSPTNASSVSYTVTFAAAVTGLSISNFALATTGLTRAGITSLSGAGTTYTVTVNTGTGDGTLGLNLASAAGISPGLSNTLPFVGQVYTIDKTAPTLVLTSSTAPTGGYTTTSPLTFVVTFSEDIASPGLLTSAGFSYVTNLGGGSSIVRTAANVFTYTIIPAGIGAVLLTIPANAVIDAAGNGNVGPVSYTIYYNVPTAAPVVTAPANGSLVATTTPTYTGTAPAGSTVTVYVDGASRGTTTATGGSFSLVQPTGLAPGAHTVYATALASGQTVSANSNTNTFTVATAPTVTLLSPATGPVGAQVMITGTNLSGATAVSFNGTPASSFVVNSATSITAVVAAGTTTGLVSVTTPSGSATSPTSFVVRVAPTTVADSYSTPQGVTLTGNVLTNDIGTNPRAILINRSTNGSLVLNPDGSFTYRPNAGFTGADSFTYYACDPAMPLLCGNPATVSITVLRIAPVTVADSYTTPAGVTLTGNVLTNDIGTNPQAILIIRPTHGTLLLNPNGTFTYQPAAGYTGPDSFLYYACDPNLPLLCGNPATVSITVLRVAPITVADTYNTPQGVTLTGNVLTNDIGTNPRAILINRPTRGTLVLNPDGSFTYQPNAGFSGADSFTYYACNMGTPLVCGDPATVSITVTAPTNTATRVATQPTGAAAANATAATPAKPAASAAGGATVRLELALTGHPNPFGDELQLRFTLPIAQAYTLAVYDAQGRLVQQLASGQAEAGQAQQLTVPTHTYAAGLYLVRLTTATGTQLLKLLKQ